MLALRTLRETPFPLVTISAMASQTLFWASPFGPSISNDFSGHRRFGSRFPRVSPVIAKMAGPFQTVSRSSPKRQGLPKHFPWDGLNRQKNGGKRMDRFGFFCPPFSCLPTALSIRSWPSAMFPGPSQLRGPPRHLPGHSQRLKGFRDISPVAHSA